MYGNVFGPGTHERPNGIPHPNGAATGATTGATAERFTLAPPTRSFPPHPTTPASRHGWYHESDGSDGATRPGIQAVMSRPRILPG